MTLPNWLYWVTLWPICSLLSYFLARYLMTKWGNPWTVGDRYLNIIFGVLLGPIYLGILAVVSLLPDWNYKESKW